MTNKTKRFLFSLEGTIETTDSEAARKELAWRMEHPYRQTHNIKQYGQTLMIPDFLKQRRSKK